MVEGTPREAERAARETGDKGLKKGAIGFMDDYDKVKKAHHSGLSAKLRLALEFAIAGAAVAIVLLHSYANPAHERRIGIGGRFDVELAAAAVGHRPAPDLVALAAREARVPFYVGAPSSSIDW